MKIAKAWLVFMLLLLPWVLAQENVSQDVSPDQNVPQDPGVTPDSFLWGVDRAIEQISLLLAADPEAKAAKGLEIARERLLEVKAMAEAKNLPALEKAQNEHSKTLLKVKENIKSMADDDPEAQLKNELKIEKELQEHEKEIKEVSAKLKVKIKVEGVLSAEQQAKLDEFLALLSESAEDVKVEIKNKKESTKVTIKEKTGKSEEEIEDDVKKSEREQGIGEEIKVRAETVGGKSFIKVDLSFDTAATDKEALLAEIVERFSLNADTAASLLKVESEEVAEEEAVEEESERLQVKVKTEEDGSEVTVKLRFSLNSTDTARIVNAVVERTQLTLGQVESVWVVKERSKEGRFEIEVEIEDGEAEIKIKTDGGKAELVLNETDREKIVQEIAAYLGISAEEVLKVVTFKEETKKETKKGSFEEEADGKTEDEGDDEDDDEDSFEEESGSNVSGGNE